MCESTGELLRISDSPRVSESRNLRTWRVPETARVHLTMLKGMCKHLAFLISVSNSGKVLPCHKTTAHGRRPLVTKSKQVVRSTSKQEITAGLLSNKKRGPEPSSKDLHELFGFVSTRSQF